MERESKFVNTKIDIKLILSSLWITLMMVFIYASCFTVITIKNKQL